MLLSDKSIKQGQEQGWLNITPFDPACVQPASYDVHLADTLLLPVVRPHVPWWKKLLGIKPPYVPWCFDPAVDTQPVKQVKLCSREAENVTGEYFYLPPGGVALGATMESLEIDRDTKIAADIAGCSSLGRWWLFVHVTAGFIDPGWPKSPLTLELYNASPWHIRLWSGMRIGQIRFYDLDGLPERSYSDIGHYGHTLGPETSKYR